MLKTPVELLTEVIKAEDQRLLASFPLPRRAALLELVRAIDELFVSLYLSPNAIIGRKEEEEDELDEIFTHGSGRALRLFADWTANEPGAPIFRSTEASRRWADSVLAYCRKLSLCERIIDMCRFNLGKLEKSSDRVLRFTFQASRVGIEWIEAAKGRGETSCNFDYSGRMIEMMMLGLVAYRSGETLNYDAKKGKTDNKTANQYLAKTYREGWPLNG